MRIGEPCSYYLDGWRYGIVRALPIKGQRKHFAQIENPTRLFSFDRAKGEWVPKACTRNWVPVKCVNAVGDTFYHGAKLVEEVAERKQTKAADVAAAKAKTTPAKPKVVKPKPVKAKPKPKAKVKAKPKPKAKPRK